MQGKLRPDYTLLFDAPVEVGMRRARDRGELDRFEQETLKFFERVRQGYLQQAQIDGNRYRLIDAGQSLDDVQKGLAEFGDELLSRWAMVEARQ